MSDKWLVHHGILGQKWGKRNGPPYPLDDQKSDGKKLIELSDISKEGKTVTLGQRPTSKFTQFISRYFPNVKENILKDKQFNIVVDGKRVGDMEIFDEGEQSLNIVWVGIDNSSRGHGYASAAMNAVIKFAKDQGYKQVTLEVPGDSPDARHIYEQLGFKDYGKISDEDDVWGGLTAMKLKL